MNLWKESETGADIPNMVNVTMEIYKGSRNVFEYDKREGTIGLDRVWLSAVHYPGDYDNGGPLDTLGVVNEPTFPMCLIEARPHWSVPHSRP